MRKLMRLWQSIEQTPGLQAISKYWQDTLGEDHSVAKKYLRPIGKLATSCVCSECGGVRKIVRHSSDDIVAICPDGCPTQRMKKGDVGIHRFDLVRFGQALAARLNLNTDVKDNGTADIHRIGAYQPTSNRTFPVFLSAHTESAAFTAAIAHLLASTATSFAVIIPTRTHLGSQEDSLLARQKSVAIVGSDVVGTDDAGNLVLAMPTEDVFEPFRELVLAYPGRRLNVFEKKGQFWTVRYGDKEIMLDDSIGTKYLAQLIATPDREIDVADLRTAFGDGKKRPISDAGDASNQQMSREIRERLQEIIEELDEARKNNDRAAQDRLTEERSGIVASLKNDTGLGGRSRKLSDDRKRVRDAVHKPIRQALKTIEKTHPDLGAHLRNSLPIQDLLIYHPVPPVYWETKLS